MQTVTTFQPSSTDIGKLYQGLMSLHEQQFPNLKEQNVACFLHDDSERVVGGVCGSMLATSLYIQYLWIEPHLRGMGWGRALMLHLETTVKDKGITHLFVDTFVGQAPNFYILLGFNETGRLRHFPVLGSERIYFSKTLSTELKK
ncbi:GNAT family N-acetyltransferase [Vibrio tritonius]|uniref:GNAT family N-acetyltransferase n=1 Tax=Vibrio tritonius TaxID=1435069 RepID=A0ABS7YNN1_9VIBR|nr:GNAT family N-acetyltransferase [Vibrio tritonius]MCA2017291.1 GNAT family N-acetyltransferase [Vibrio tritonius]